MFTLEQIKEAHSKVKSGADFPNYIQDLIKLGVLFYKTYVVDGSTEYFGKDEYKATTSARYSNLIISDNSNVQEFIIRLKIHQQGKTDYISFCNDCASTGVEKWEVNTQKMTCTYFNKAGDTILTEPIPQ